MKLSALESMDASEFYVRLVDRLDASYDYFSQLAMDVDNVAIAAMKDGDYDSLAEAAALADRHRSHASAVEFCLQLLVDFAREVLEDE